MPIYEYECGGCHQAVELLIRRSDEQPQCPHCGSTALEKLMSVPAAPATGQSNTQLPMAGPGEGCGAPRCCGGGCAME